MKAARKNKQAKRRKFVSFISVFHFFCGRSLKQRKLSQAHEKKGFSLKAANCECSAKADLSNFKAEGK